MRLRITKSQKVSIPCLCVTVCGSSMTIGLVYDVKTAHRHVILYGKKFNTLDYVGRKSFLCFSMDKNLFMEFYEDF